MNECFKLCHTILCQVDPESRFTPNAKLSKLFMQVDQSKYKFNVNWVTQIKHVCCKCIKFALIAPSVQIQDIELESKIPVRQNKQPSSYLE